MMWNVLIHSQSVPVLSQFFRVVLEHPIYSRFKLVFLLHCLRYTTHIEFFLFLSAVTKFLVLYLSHQLISIAVQPLCSLSTLWVFPSWCGKSFNFSLHHTIHSILQGWLKCTAAIVIISSSSSRIRSNCSCISDYSSILLRLIINNLLILLTLWLLNVVFYKEYLKLIEFSIFL